MTVDELQQKLAAPIHVVAGALALQKQLGGKLE